MQHDLELGYLGLEVSDPASLEGFFGEVIGLAPGEPAHPGRGHLAQRREGPPAHRGAGGGQRRQLRRLRGDQ
jgi:hypothetical protein